MIIFVTDHEPNLHTLLCEFGGQNNYQQKLFELKERTRRMRAFGQPF